MNDIRDPKVPQHIAVIMDGNRRWARERGMHAVMGHRHVVDHVLEPLIEHAAKSGVKFMTFWAFSTENWQRDKEEVGGIMSLFRNALKDRGHRLHDRGVRVRIIGDLSKFDADIRKMLEDLVELTRDNTNITAVFALNYGGRDEIIRAINHSVTDSEWRGRNAEMTQENFSHLLDTSGIPDPELIVRTGGEQRLSGFLLWQSEYSELYFPTFFMPDFTPARLDEAIEEYHHRKRRFGK